MGLVGIFLLSGGIEQLRVHVFCAVHRTLCPTGKRTFNACNIPEKDFLSNMPRSDCFGHKKVLYYLCFWSDPVFKLWLDSDPVLKKQS